MVRARPRDALAVALLLAAPLAVAGCGTTAAASPGSIVVEASSCLGVVTPFVTLSQGNRQLTVAEVRAGEAHAFRVPPGSYTVSDGPLAQPVEVGPGRVVRVALLPVCAPRTS